MNAVFIVWHTHQIGEDAEEKLIGVYESRTSAAEAIVRMSSKPGFRDEIAGFEISEYTVGRDHWTEGYVSQMKTIEPSKE